MSLFNDYSTDNNAKLISYSVSSVTNVITDKAYEHIFHPYRYKIVHSDYL